MINIQVQTLGRNVGIKLLVDDFQPHPGFWNSAGNLSGTGTVPNWDSTLASPDVQSCQDSDFMLHGFHPDASLYWPILIMTSHDVHDSNAIIPNTGTTPDYSPLNVGNIIPRMGTSIPMILHDYPNSYSIDSNYTSIVWYYCNVMWVEISGIYIHFRKMGKKIDFR